MAIDTGSLRKILELEDKKGYLNTAVIGGLDKFLQQWSVRIQKSITDARALKNFLKICPAELNYAEMTIPVRKDWAGKILQYLNELEKPKTNFEAGKPFPKKKDLPQVEIKTEIAKSPKPINKKLIKQSLEASIIAIKGINLVLQKKFNKLGVITVRDLLYYFPHRHLDYSQRTYINKLNVGIENTIIATVWEAREVQLGRRRSAEATVGDETGNVRIVWFNQPYLAKSLKTGERVVISGKVTLFGGMPVFESPEWEPYEDKDLTHTGRLVPVYPLTQGLSQRQVRRIIKPALDQWTRQLDEFLPASLRERQKLLGLP